MVHHGIANKDGIHDQALVNLRFSRNLGEQCVHTVAHGPGHFLVTTRVHHRIADPAHQILAKPDLRVHQSRGGDNFTGAQIAQMRGDCG